MDQRIGGAGDNDQRFGEIVDRTPRPHPGVNRGCEHGRIMTTARLLSAQPDAWPTGKPGMTGAIGSDLSHDPRRVVTLDPDRTMGVEAVNDDVGESPDPGIRLGSVHHEMRIRQRPWPQIVQLRRISLDPYRYAG